MKVTIKNLTKFKINNKNIKNFVKKVVKLKGIKKGELNIIFVGNKRIRDLNFRFRNENAVTNVLAFNLTDEELSFFPANFVCEIIISLQKAKQESKILKVSFVERIKRLIVHGILHTLGYCDYTTEDDVKMEIEEDKILRKVK